MDEIIDPSYENSPDDTRIEKLSLRCAVKPH